MLKELIRFTSTSKINLYLDIIGKDSVDGYHFLESIFYEIPWGDDFIISQALEDNIHFHNDTYQQISAENTVTKTLRLFKQKFKINECFDIQITKNVPMGAGLGGGSGNAGALLKWLANRYQQPISNCLDIAQQIGSDVPFFLYGGMALVEGKGEIITPLTNQLNINKNLLIIYPGIHISTKEAFASIDVLNIQTKEKLREKKIFEKNEWSIDNINEIMYNIFNDNLESLNKELFLLRNRICNLLSPDTIMTGSGSSFISFIDKEEEGVLQIKKDMEQFLNDCSSIYILSI